MPRLHHTFRALALAGVLAALAGPAAADPMAQLQAAFSRAVPAGERADFYRDLFPTVLERVQRSHAKDVDTAELAGLAMRSLEPLPAGEGDPAEVFGTAINAALRTLDGYTRYYDAQAYGRQRGESAGRFGGVGLQLEPVDGAVRVAEAMPDGPAARAGVQAGDLIVRVDERPLAGQAFADAVARLRGEPGTPVSLGIRRDGQEFTLAVTRDTIRTQPLRWSLEDEVLVLRLSTFSAPVSSALAQAVTQVLATQSPRAVVLDLRGNGGGLLREAVRTADAFLAHGDIVSVRGRHPSLHRAWQADADELLPGLPMVVLIDRRSASAAELLAAALQENGRAVVMGQRSFGKGTVQVTYPLGEDKGAVKLTTSAYYAPSGRAVQGAGVAPDIELAVAQRRDVPASAPLAPPRVSVAQERCVGLAGLADPGVACAVAYLRAGSADAFAAAMADVQP